MKRGVGLAERFWNRQAPDELTELKQIVELVENNGSSWPVWSRDRFSKANLLHLRTWMHRMHRMVRT